MSTIKNINAVIEAIGRWNTIDLTHIEKLVYQAKTEFQDSSVLIVGVMQRQDSTCNDRLTTAQPSYRVSILCQGIRDLSLSDFTSTPTQISGFEITDISDLGWEQLRFEISDYEDNQIRFYCKTIEILDVEPI